jgi:hypothetical protein
MGSYCVAKVCHIDEVSIKKGSIVPVIKRAASAPIIKYAPSSPVSQHAASTHMIRHEANTPVIKYYGVIFHYVVIVYIGMQKQYHSRIGLYAFIGTKKPNDWRVKISSAINAIINEHALPSGCRWRLNIHAINSYLMENTEDIEDFDYYHIEGRKTKQQ